MVSGVLNIYKEKGYTSHDVVAKMRGIFRQRKIGHAGTLDPEAEGVLPVCLGNATRIADLLTDHSKTYRAGLRFGLVTDTQDSTGQVLEEGDPSYLTEEEARRVILSFVGPYAQIPPMYSAKKQNGKKLYELARAGITVEREPAQVTVHRIDIRNMQLPEAVLEVDCSRGTYIRTLCHDIGQAAGCGAVMTGLLRTRVGSFHVEDSVTLSQLEEKIEAGELERFLIPVEELFLDVLRGSVFTEEGDRKLKNGNALTPPELQVPPGLPRVRACDMQGRFRALYRYDETRQLYVPEKMFPE